MNLKVKFLLPSAQMILAACLMWSNFQKADPVWNPAWYQPDWQICMAVNAPAFFIAKYPADRSYSWFLNHPAPPSLFLISDRALRLMLIWLLWYVVAIEIGGAGQSVLAGQTRFRRAADGLAIAFGAAMLLSTSHDVSRLIGGYAKLMSIPYILWTATILGFYGHDLWVSFGANKEMSG